MKQLLVLTFLLVSQITYSCTCYSIPLDKKLYKKYGLIIKGEIIKVEEAEYTKIIHIKVDTYYKGKQKATTVKVETPNSSGMCGIYFEVGEQWLIFAYKKGNTYSTTLCTRTKTLNPKSSDYKEAEIKADVKFLEGRMAGSRK